jgi:ligand-binding sensor domain-containing protein
MVYGWFYPATEQRKIDRVRYAEDRSGRIWLATKGQGLWLLKNRDPSFTSFYVTHFQHQSEDRYSLLTNNLYELYEDSYSRMWIASYEGGLQLIDESNGRLRFLHAGNVLRQYPLETGARVRCLEGDHNGNIWVGTTNGFIVFSEDFKQPSAIKFYDFSREDGSRKPIYSSDIYDIVCDSAGRVWMGTFGSGLLLCQTYQQGIRPQLTCYNKRNGFFTDIILGIAEDNQHNLWLVSEHTLARFNPRSGYLDQNNLYNGLESGDFLESAVYKTRNGTLLIGNALGFYEINPGNIVRNKYAPAIVLTRFQLFGRDVPVGAKGVL